tara:strand:+ start:315 stop:803 length:489 start_codon:yes stop_codon:yes gene_type:complete
MAEDDTVNDLLAQLHQTPETIKKVREKFELEGEDLEQFILEYCGRLIKGSVESVEEFQDKLDYASTADEVDALASLIRASSSSVDVLTKILNAREKNKNAKEVTQMKIESTDQNVDKAIGARLQMNREDLLKELIEDSKKPDPIPVEGSVIDVELEEEPKTS